MQQILEKLIGRERQSAENAAVAWLRSRFVAALAPLLLSSSASGSSGGNLDAILAVLKKIDSLEAEAENVRVQHREAAAIAAMPIVVASNPGENATQSGATATAVAPVAVVTPAVAAEEEDAAGVVAQSKAWSRLLNDVEAVRSYLDSLHATAAAAAAASAQPAVASSSGGSCGGAASGTFADLAAMASAPTPCNGDARRKGGGSGTTAAARSRGRRALPKLWLASQQLAQGKRSLASVKTAVEAVVDRESRKLSVFEHSLNHLRGRAEAALLQQVERDADSALSRQCPICFDGLEAAWAVTPCGHEYCHDCIASHLNGSSRGKPCPVCRADVKESELFVVKGGAGADLERERRDAFGTKLSELVAVVVTHLSKPNSGKVIIFSGWTRLLKLTAEALLTEAIRTAMLSGSNSECAEALRAFRQSGNIPTAPRCDSTDKGVGSEVSDGPQVLMIPLFSGSRGAGGGGAAGLTLTDASLVSHAARIVDSVSVGASVSCLP